MKIHKIEAGTFYCDGGAVFGVVPKKVWQKRYPCNEENFCKLAMRCLLIDTDDKLILIDTGAGKKQPDYLRYYNVEDAPDISNEIARLGYSAEQVTDVIHTHLHFDHCGGATYYDKDNNLQLTFPNATYWLTEQHWKNFLHPNVREGDSFFPENMLPVEQADKLRLIDKTTHITPEIELRICNGHSVGQIVPYIAYKGKTCVYVGDVVPFAASIPLAWIAAYDVFPVTSMEEKAILLQEAADKEQVLIFEHDAYVECCTVQKIEGKFKSKETFLLSDLK